MRKLVRETHIEKSDLIYPIFVEEGENIKLPVESMPGVFRYSVQA
jgi:porphobilinogen synthase